MKKKYPIRQEKKELPAVKPNRLKFLPPVRQRVVFFRLCRRRRH